MSTNPLETFEKRTAEWNMHSRPVLDRATWLLVHAAAARFAGLDPTTADLKDVAQALRGHPEVVTDALRLLDQADVRRAAWREQEEARRVAASIAERQKRHARGLRAYLERLRTDPRWYTSGELHVMERWPHGEDPTLTFEAVLHGTGPSSHDLAYSVLGARSFRRAKRDLTRLLNIIAARMCEMVIASAARDAAMLWLRLRGFTGSLAAAVAEIEAEVERRA